MKRLGLALFAALALGVWAAPPTLPMASLDSRPAATPIIAELMHRPGDFVGRRVKIYGVVVGTAEGGRFLLNDVSQMPIQVLPPKGGKPMPVGSQLLVTGIVRMSGSGVMVAGEHLLPVQVVAGGGCC